MHVIYALHYDVIQWKNFPRYWPFVRGIHRSPMNSPHKGQWRGALMFSLICAWTNSWVNIRDAGDLRRHRSHCDVTVICCRDRIWVHRCRTLQMLWRMWPGMLQVDVKTHGRFSFLIFYTPVFRRDVLWYGAVRPSVRLSVRPFVRPSGC